MQTHKYIVNADDFGFSTSINKAIVSAFKDGLISSATVMANMPGFSEIFDLIYEYRLEKKLGIHLNITEGSPLTKMITSQNRFCDSEGKFANSLPRNVLSLKSEEAISLRCELKAQIEKCLTIGIQPTHIDSHHHIHTIWPIGTLVMSLAREYRIPVIRLSQNIALTTDMFRRVYKYTYNLRLRILGFTKCKYFVSADNLESINYQFSDRTEISVHPIFNLSGVVMASPDQKSPTLVKLIESLSACGKMSSYWECCNFSSTFYSG